MAHRLDRPIATDARTDRRLAVADGWLARALGIVLLAAISVIHLADLGGKLEETPYLGVGYVLLIVGCVVAGVQLALPRRDAHGRGWLLAGSLAALTIFGFVLTRTTGLPQAADDKGNWTETLGLWSLITEGALVVLSATCLASLGRTERALT